MTNQRLDINPVIVNFRTPDLTLKCVASIVEHELAASDDIIVVENASPDDSLARLRTELPAGRLIESKVNGGYGAGVNLGAAVATREFILVLNPDTYFIDGSLKKAIDVLKADPSVGLVGLDLVYPHGAPQYPARRFYSLLDIIARRTIFGRFPILKSLQDRHLMKDAWVQGQPFDAEWVMGTGFLIRRDVFASLSGMDEKYFLYMEDVDLCARVWQAGLRVVCVPGAKLVHDHQRGSAASLFGRAARMHAKSVWRFGRKFRVPMLTPPGVQKLWR